MRALLFGILYICASNATCTQAQSPSAPVANDLFPAELFAPVPAPRIPDSDLAIVFWFDWHNAAGTLRHQVYDRRNAEFTPAVHDWLTMIRRQYPDYVTSVRYVDVGRRAVAEVVGETVDATRSALEADSARIRRTEQSHRLSELYHSYEGSGTRVRAGTPLGRSPHRIGIFGAPGASGAVGTAPSTYLFPTPYPYPRPHP